jgi:hypothetical protein
MRSYYFEFTGSYCITANCAASGLVVQSRMAAIIFSEKKSTSCGDGAIMGNRQRNPPGLRADAFRWRNDTSAWDFVDGRGSVALSTHGTINKTRAR